MSEPVEPTAPAPPLRPQLAVAWLERDVLEVSGPEAVAWLQGQLSQDVAALEVGTSAWSFLLQPQGKVDALLRATRTAVDSIVLDVEGGWGEAVAQRLNRYRLRTKATLTPLTWRCLGLRGPGATDAGTAAGGQLLADAAWPGIEGVDALGPAVSVPDGVELCDAATWDSLRIEAGVPAMGTELDERTIPAESGFVDIAASFTKGCYTGQELVARIDSRGGNVPRRLRGLVVDGEEVPPPGAALWSAERQVGSVTSSTRSLLLGAPIALAYVKREVEPPAALELRWDGHTAGASVRALPLVG